MIKCLKEISAVFRPLVESVPWFVYYNLNLFPSVYTVTIMLKILLYFTPIFLLALRDVVVSHTHSPPLTSCFEECLGGALTPSEGEHTQNQSA